MNIAHGSIYMISSKKARWRSLFLSLTYQGFIANLKDSKNFSYDLKSLTLLFLLRLRSVPLVFCLKKVFIQAHLERPFQVLYLLLPMINTQERVTIGQKFEFCSKVIFESKVTNFNCI